MQQQRSITMVPVKDIFPSATNPRKYFNEEKLKELSASILKVGVIQAITVREQPDRSGKYEIVCGERRYRASMLAGIDSIPAEIKVLTDDEVQELQFIENIEREDVHPMDEAVTFKAMTQNKNRPWTLEDIAAKINKPITYVAQRMQLINLIPDLQKDFWDEKFLIGHAVLFARLNSSTQKEILKNRQVFDKKEYATIKETADFIDTHVMMKLSAAPFKKDDATLVPAAGACLTCSKRTGSNPSLFPDIVKEDRCIDKACFKDKSQAHLLLQVQNILTTKPETFLVAGYPGASDDVKQLAEKYKVKIIEQSGHTISDSSWGDYKIKTTAFMVSGYSEGKYKTMYRKVTGKVQSTASADSTPTAEDIDLQIAAINQRKARGIELDEEKVWDLVSEKIKDPALYKIETVFTQHLIQEEINAMAYLFLRGIHLCYKPIIKQFTAIDYDDYFNRESFDSISKKCVTVKQLFVLMRLYTLSELNSIGSSFVSAKKYALMPMLLTDEYFKDDIALLQADQNDVRAKREGNALKKINALKEQKASIAPVANKIAPAAKKIASKSKIKKLV